MISHNFITTEQLRFWHATVSRYALTARGRTKTIAIKRNLTRTPIESQSCAAKTRNTENKYDKSLIENNPTQFNPLTYVNHPVLWNHSKVTVHTSSSKWLVNQSHYGCYSLVFSALGGQMPKLVKAKQSVAGFKLIKASPLGVASYLRGRLQVQFSYKWAFLAPSAKGAADATKNRNACGLTHVFVFPELDILDYSAFEPLSGLDLNFDVGKETASVC